MANNNGSSMIDTMSMVAGKIGNQRHLGAIRDGFITLMPLLIVGSLVTLINNFPVGSGSGDTLRWVYLEGNPMFQWLANLNGSVWWGTFGMISIFATMTISYSLAKSYDANCLSAAVISLASFLSAVPQMAIFNLADGTEAAGWGFINYKYVNATGLFVAIIVSLIATEIFVRLSKSDKLIIKMPAGVPPAVSRSFASLLPGMLTVLAVGLMAVAVDLIAKMNIFDLISTTIMSPLSNASGSLGFGFAIVFLTHLLWAFGIHGPNIFEAILQPLNVMAIEQNLAVAADPTVGSTVIFSKSFADAFIYMGGSGVGLGLVIAILLASKTKSNRMIGNLGFAPGLFNINEPVIFGLPIVLNPIFIIPFIIAPIVSLLIAYGATMAGFLPVVTAVIPWTTPPILSGLFATGFAWQGPVIQIINLSLSILIYLPFVKMADKVEMKKEAEAAEKKAAREKAKLEAQKKA